MCRIRGIRPFRIVRWEGGRESSVARPGSTPQGGPGAAGTPISAPANRSGRVRGLSDATPDLSVHRDGARVVTEHLGTRYIIEAGAGPARSSGVTWTAQARHAAHAALEAYG